MATISFTTKFSLNTTPKKFVFIDITNYAGQGISVNDVNGSFTIVDPQGTTIYNNTTYTPGGSDINISGSTTNQTTIPLPFLNNGDPEPGTYTITYTVYNSNLAVYYTQVNTYTFSYTSPTVSLSDQVDCAAPYLTCNDLTNYIVGGITPTNSRTLTLQPPANSGGATITNTTSSFITTSTFYTGMSSFTNTSILTYTFSDGLIVLDTVTGTKSITVDCSFICLLYCCLRAINNRLNSYQNTNSVKYAETKDEVLLIGWKLELLEKAVACGKQDDANSLLAEIKTIANCQDDCSCTDSTPRLVTGLGAGPAINVVVVSGGAPVVVTPNTVNGVTTYTITLSPSFIATVNNFYNTLVVATDSTVTVTDSGVVGGVRTFSVKANYPAAQNRLEFLARIQPANFAAPVHTITKSAYLFSGSNIIGTAAVTATDIANPNFAVMNNLYTVTTFQTAPNNNYKVTASVEVHGQDNTLVGGLGTWTAAQMKGLYNPLQIQILNKTSGNFQFRFVYASGTLNGAAPNNKMMCAWPDLFVSIKISE